MWASKLVGDCGGTMFPVVDYYDDKHNQAKD